MIKLLHVSDVQLDAPFEFLGEKGALHRQRIQQTFADVVHLARRGAYHALLIAGDLFNSNGPSRKTVQFVAETLGGLAIPVLILPGNHDCYDKSSVYRKSSFPRNVTIFSQSPTYLDFPDMDLTVAGNPLPARHTVVSPLAGIRRSTARRWFVVLAHGNVQIPGRIENTERPIRSEEIEGCGADYIGLGDWHAFADVSKGKVKAFYSGSPEPTAIDQRKAGFVASVSLSTDGVSVEQIRVGRIRADGLTLDLTGLSKEEVIESIRLRASPELMLDVTLTGASSMESVIDVGELEQPLGESFYFIRVKNQSAVSVTDADILELPESHVIGQFARMLRARIQTAADEKSRHIAERALQLGVALLRGEGGLG